MTITEATDEDHERIDEARAGAERLACLMRRTHELQARARELELDYTQRSKFAREHLEQAMWDADAWTLLEASAILRDAA